ncbi:MAG: hypothetical protein V7739_10760 [Motiliproteus sp.]
MDTEDQPSLNPDTPLQKLAGLGSAAQKKLQQLGAFSLADVAAKLSRAQLKQARHVGPKSLQLLEQSLQQVGLTLADNRINASAELQVQISCYQRDTAALQQQVDSWVQLNRPELEQAWRSHQQGAYGDYIKAQLLALNEVAADPQIKREFEHQLVRTLSRYQRQQRYALSREALHDGIRAQARVRSSTKKRPC